MKNCENLSSTDGRGPSPDSGANLADSLGTRGPKPRSTVRVARLRRHPLGWLTVGVVSVAAVSALTATGEAGTPGAILVPVAGAVVAVVVYWLVMRLVARRPVPELALRGAGREALLGAGVGGAFVLGSALIVAALGAYSFSWSLGLGAAAVLPLVAVSVGAGVTEELIFRGLALQALERAVGSVAALLVTATLFGALHLANPGATMWSSIAIAVEAGLLLGAAFLWRRSIWFAIGLHVTWNSVQGMLGIPISGHVSPGVLSAEATGPGLLTGGSFGLEASVVTVLIGLLLAMWMFGLAGRRGLLVTRQSAAETRQPVSRVGSDEAA